MTVPNACPANTATIATGSVDITSCKSNPGFYGGVSSVTDVVLACSPGTYSLTVGAVDSSTCITCPAGYFCNTTSTAPVKCALCPPGTYAPTAGAYSCQTCPGAAAGASTCTALTPSWDLTTDFSITSNPSGQWIYGTSIDGVTVTPGLPMRCRESTQKSQAHWPQTSRSSR